MADATSRHDAVETLLAEQRAYYRARAPIYDDWWYRRGGHDLGPELNDAWHEERARLEAALEAFAPRGRVLELAGGTGTWTEHLARHADELTVVDASPETLAINEARLQGARVVPHYVEADLFAWTPEATYDVVSFTFWLSHVPLARFDAFWATVEAALAPGGRVFFADNPPPGREPAAIRERFRRDGPVIEGVDSLSDLAHDTSVRRLPDGSAYRIVKRFWEPRALEQRLRDLGWVARVEPTAWAFYWGTAQRG